MSISSQPYWSLIFELYLIFKYSKVPNFAKEMSVPLISSVLDNYQYLYPSWIGTDPTINIGCNVLLVSNSNHCFKWCAKGYFTYIFINKNLINYVNAVMPIFLSTIWLMNSVMSFTAELVFVVVLLPYHVLIKVIHYGIIIENDLFLWLFLRVGSLND